MACHPTNDYYICCAELQLVTFLLLVKHLSMYIATYYENFTIYINIAEIVKLCTHVNACVCVCVCVCMSVCVHVCYVCMCAYTYMCMCVYACICACVYHIHAVMLTIRQNLNLE